MGAAASVDSTNLTNGFKPTTGSRRRSGTSTGSSSRTSGSRRHKAPSPANTEVFKDLVDTKFSFETAYAKVDPVMNELRKFDSARTDQITPALDFLFSYTSNKYGQEICQMWVEKLERTGLVPIMMKLWPSFWDPDLLQCANKDSGNGVQKDNITLENFWFVCRIIWNGSDASVALCKSLVNTGTVEEMLKIVSREDFDPKTMKKDEVRSYITKASTGIIHNCVRHYHEEAKKRFREARGIQSVKGYVDSDMPVLVAKASVILANCTNDAEKELAAELDNIVKTLIKKLLEPSLSRSSKRAHGFTISETVTAMGHLAQSDVCKTKLIQAGVYPLCVKVIEQANNDQELEAVVNLVWLLSFSPDSKSSNSKIIQQLVTALQTLRQHGNHNISMAATGALWNLNGDLNDNGTKRTHSGPPTDRRGRPRVSEIPVPADRHSSASSLPSQKNRTVINRRSSETSKRKNSMPEHIMISYHGNNSNIAQELNRALKQVGYVTWINTDQTESSLESTAAAIDHSAVVLICICEDYQKSPICRAEAEYAYRLGKDLIPVKLEKFSPDGWLGVLLGSRLYFHCVKTSDVPSCVRKISKELGSRAKMASVTTVNGKHDDHDSDTEEKGEKEAKSDKKDSKRTKSPQKSKSKDNNKEDKKEDSRKHRRNSDPKTPPANRSSSKKRNDDDSPSRPTPIPEEATDKEDQEEDDFESDERPTTSRKKVHLWSSEDVQAWLGHVGLPHMAKNFRQFDGQLLLELRHMYKTSPQVFYQSAREELGLTHLSDLLRVTQHLNQLPVAHDETDEI